MNTSPVPPKSLAPGKRTNLNHIPGCVSTAFSCPTVVAPPREGVTTHRDAQTLATLFTRGEALASCPPPLLLAPLGKTCLDPTQPISLVEEGGEVMSVYGKHMPDMVLLTDTVYVKQSSLLWQHGVLNPPQHRHPGIPTTCSAIIPASRSPPAASSSFYRLHPPSKPSHLPLADAQKQIMCSSVSPSLVSRRENPRQAAQPGLEEKVLFLGQAH